MVTSTGTAPVASAPVKKARAAVRSRLVDSHVYDLPVLVDCPVQVRPPSVDLDVGLVGEPAVTWHVAACPRCFDELRCEALDPPVDGDVIDVHSPLGEQLLDIAVGGRTAGSTAPPPRSPPRGNRKPANAEADEHVMTPVSCPVRWLNATVPAIGTGA